jgi:hypothetical protein
MKKNISLPEEYIREYVAELIYIRKVIFDKQGNWPDFAVGRLDDLIKEMAMDANDSGMSWGKAELK